jgi:exo-beta-1,3-glucanase (GH17 family)
MWIVRTGLALLPRLAACGVLAGLAACGDSQNWSGKSEFVTIGGTVTGLSGGSVVLWNNGGDRLTVAQDGSFTFPLQLARDSRYAVSVAQQPSGRTCLVKNGTSITGGANVRDITVNCTAYTFTPRPLPAVYRTGRAVNYGPYRTVDGPRAGEVPTDAQILEDLTLMNTAGIELIRLFGADAPGTDVVTEKVLRIASQNFPDLKFHLGIGIAGVTSCSDTKNDRNIANVITNLSKLPNVVAISVGNETSFFSKFMPTACLETYLRTVRSQVTQPVTTDDDWTFYAGKTTAGGDRAEVRPDTILPLIDFASIHIYPISNPVWDWQQTGVAAGPARAEAMMEESLVAAKAWFAEVANYSYRSASGSFVTVGDSMPIVLGETGWKAKQTNPNSEIEFHAADPVNQKWYIDLLIGAAGRYPAWEGTSDGPVRIFYFEAFDEQWKGTDDGWGMWDLARQARYALCGTPAGAACNADVYAGAGFYDPPPFSTVTFDSATTNYALVGFAGAEDSQVVADPLGGTNKVGRVNRANTADVFAGTVIGTAGGLTVGQIPFDASNTRMTVRVYSPAAGINVRLKVEDSSNASHSVETEATTTVANGWETLTFDFANEVAGTPALNPAFTYNRVIIFFNFGVLGSTAGAQTFYFDDVTFIGGGGLGGGSIVFASGYASNNRTVEGGEWGFYSGNFTSYANTYAGGGFTDQGVAAADSFVYLVITTSAPTTDGFMGIFTAAPGSTIAAPNAGVTLDGQTTMKIEIGMAAEWFQQPNNKALTVRLIGAEVFGDGNGNSCRILLDTPLTPTTADLTTYTVTLSSMTLAQPCNGGGFTSGVTSVAQALARPIGEVHVQAVYPQVNTTVLGGPEYPTGFTRGSVTFE